MNRSVTLWLLLALLIAHSASGAEDRFVQDIVPMLNKYCTECHSGSDPNGDVDLATVNSSAGALEAFETLSKVNELLSARKMPPKDEPQPSQRELDRFGDWYQNEFLNSIDARPSDFRPRRMSATEYRNTIRSLFGFDLEVSIRDAEQTITEKSLVLKLLPTDPPGPSGFRNDTSGNPLTSHVWEQYAYLVDFALEELFSPPRRKRIETLAGAISDEGFDRENALSLVRYFATNAWRRDLDEPVMNATSERIEDGTPVVAAKREIKTILMSPQFIYRGLMMKGTPGKQPVDDFELAERLSYFLWADMPDEQLLRAARNGQLQERETLKQQVERMLDSPKSANLATDFATQWLALDEIDQVSNNPPYMVALKSQPIDFFNYMIAEDRPLIELIDSNVTFANTHTRKFYPADAKQLKGYQRRKGIEVEIVANRRVTLDNTKGRGGILTMPGVLAMNRGPILRGVWMLERVLGEHLADPPANVGQVKANIPGANLTFRERFAQHRANESCAICHDKIDPLGFALESYDNNGRFKFAKDDRNRKQKKGDKTNESTLGFDTSGILPTGETFEDFDELKEILKTSQRSGILKNIVKQMLAYALCRKLEAYDQPTINDILKQVEPDGTWRDLALAIADSLPFRETVMPQRSESE